MGNNPETGHLQQRMAALEMDGEEFRRLGHRLVDDIAEFLNTLRGRPVTTGEPLQSIRHLLGSDLLPEQPVPADELLAGVTPLLFDHSLFNGHPRFLGYITSSASPIGALADLLAAAVNPNVGAAILSPVASEIEAQTIRWIADLIGYPRSCGGLLVSGGNMANFVCFLAARKAKATWDLKEEGLSSNRQRMIVYVSQETHTWIDKAAELFGMGAKSVRWISANSGQMMNLDALEKQIIEDLADDYLPFLVVGTAGTVSTGATDPLPQIGEICKKYNLWFHVDGAYGAPAAALPDASPDLLGLRVADSIALDPHKWLYSPLEAGCALVRDPHHLVDTFSHHPAYYHFDSDQEDPAINYFEFGMQNSRGFRALKVWLGLRQAGRSGYIRMISDDIALAGELFRIIDAHQELQAVTHNMSIVTFRYVPHGQSGQAETDNEYLNRLNEELITRLQAGGEAFVSNAVIDGKFLLRACIVNFRTRISDIEALPEIIVRLGREVTQDLS